MDNVAEYLNTCSTSTGLLGIAVLIAGGIYCLWKQGNDNRKELKEDMKELKDDLKSDIKDLKSDIKEIKLDIKSLDSRVSSIERRIYGVETMLHMKDCCMLKDDAQVKKAE